MTDDDIIDGILDREGDEYTNDPADRGGPTKHGITMKRLSESRGHICTPGEVQALTQDEARDIYRVEYIHKPGFDSIHDPSLRVLVVDFGVNSGTGTATKAVQAALQIPVDGIFGPLTRDAVNQAKASRLYAHVIAARIRLCGSIIAHDPHSTADPKAQARFAGGWANRSAEFVESLGDLTA